MASVILCAPETVLSIREIGHTPLYNLFLLGILVLPIAVLRLLEGGLLDHCTRSGSHLPDISLFRSSVPGNSSSRVLCYRNCLSENACPKYQLRESPILLSTSMVASC